ncbi:unnamed protein product [Amoebophrya sp. A25]|nr:unnamed protein product [Amoebophrya sp. A25]|eukprot:GSA25T00016757001.1
MATLVQETPVYAGHEIGHLSNAAAKWVDLSGSWNLFRRAGDLLHLGGTLFLLVSILLRRSTLGISWKTQFLYTVVFFTRYLDLPDNIWTYRNFPQEAAKMEYLILFKGTYMLVQVVILFLFFRFNAATNGTYETHKDTFNIWFVLVPYFIIAALFAQRRTVSEICWTYSEYIEAFVMVPQYVFQYRNEKQSPGRGDRHPSVFIWIMCIGLYRCLYFLNWMWKELHNDYVAPHSLIGGSLQILLFSDFLTYYICDISCLRTLVLYSDDKINDAGDAIELRAFPSRAPEVEQKRLRRRNRNEPGYQQVGTDLGDPTMVGRPEFDDIL